MDLEDWQNLQNRLDSVHRHCLGSQIGSREFYTMHKTVDALLQKADAEWVNCRRYGRGSIRFNELLAQAEEALKNFEGYVLLAKLMHKENR